MLYSILAPRRYWRANEITRVVAIGLPDGKQQRHTADMRYSMYVMLTTFGWILVASGDTDVRNEGDICGPRNGRRLYVELGEKGILRARNVTFAARKPEPNLRKLAPRHYNANAINSSHHRCSLELVTCPSCVIIAVFESIALPRHCGDGDTTSVPMDGPCRCDYAWLSEPPYDHVSGTPFCGAYTPITYRSSTRTLSINLLYSQSHEHAFTIEYTAERNRLHLKGTEMTSGAPTKGWNGTAVGGILTSPFFPARYPRDLGLEYVVTCPSHVPSCRIRLLFSDFQLASVSIMEFYDWNGQRLDVSSGARFRPPVILSSGPSLLMRFYANGGTGLGYKAFYSFVLGYTHEKSVQPITDCGGYVEDLGGVITMMNMVGQGAKIYDCVWLIRPPKNFLHTKTHMYLKVADFADMAGNTELIIKQGPTSALMSLQVIRHPASRLQPLGYREHIAPITSGFHVSLRGTFGPNSHLAIAYAAFSYTDCFTATSFLCRNHRCIPSQLNCDGFDHCGDNSDEPATCLHDWEMEPRDRKSRMNKANYYFPKNDRYPDLKTATLIFVVSSLGLILMISALIILLYKIGARARQQRELQSRLETISELLDSARIDEISISDDPPGYEAPPGYEEITKLTWPKKARCLNRESCSRNSPSQHDVDTNSSSYLVSDDRSSQTIPIVPENGQHAPRVIPESPPPAYMTPPASALRNVNLASLSASVRHICPIRRRTWLRRSAQYPRSASADHPPADGHLSLPADLDILHRYVQTVLQVAQDDVARVSSENDGQAPASGNSKRPRRAIDRSSERDTASSREGARGCCDLVATETRHAPSETLDSQLAATVFSPAKSTDKHQREDAAISKNAIVRLLGSKLMKQSSRHSDSLDSTAASSPCGTLSRPSSRKFSPDNCVAPAVPAIDIKTCNSHEKLQDEFKIISVSSVDQWHYEL